MNNLFSTFEPGAFLEFPLNWISSVIAALVLVPLFWATGSPACAFLKTLINEVSADFKAVIKSWAIERVLIVPVTLFIYIAITNFLGLFPYVFTTSSHLVFTISLALPLWTGYTLIGWYKNPRRLLAHLVPLGTPLPLIPFIVIIELIRNIIRPLTLSVRLAANIIAGHLLMTLLGSMLLKTAPMFVTIILIGLVLLAVLETAVALIQAYVFSALRTLYVDEVNSPKL